MLIINLFVSKISELNVDFTLEKRFFRALGSSLVRAAFLVNDQVCKHLKDLVKD